MLYKIKKVEPMNDYKLRVSFENGDVVLYDMNDDINTLPKYDELKKINGLFNNVKVDESKTIICWNDYIDLPSDILYEYGIKQ